MKSIFHFAALSAGLLVCAVTNAQSYTGYPSLNKAEALQLTQKMTPKARSELAKREAYAAYDEALAACKKMDKAEQKACRAQAKDYLKHDLNYAKNILTGDTSMGSSASGSTGAGRGERESAGTMPEEQSQATVRVPLVVVVSPKEQYKLSVREAHAAYAEAVRMCKTHAQGDKAACMKEAKSNLRSDLAYAKDRMQHGGQSTGGGSDAGMSGAGRW